MHYILSLFVTFVLFLNFASGNNADDEKFFASAREGDTRYIEACLEVNPSLVSSRDSRGNSALVIAAGRGRIDVLKILLKYRANPEDHTNSGLFEGKSALSWAASQG
jgi:ankyrin repeat protein